MTQCKGIGCHHIKKCIRYNPNPKMGTPFYTYSPINKNGECEEMKLSKL